MKLEDANLQVYEKKLFSHITSCILSSFPQNTSGILPETVFWRCSLKKLFLKTSQNLQENTFARASFLIKLQASGLQLY